ncbi:prophage regulatory protein [Nitrosomonas sp. Nm51]|uniref:helix-turn-helix transcriptional regulator n=1 Tax=Nitrosomonas sp. Nm51 TaxID=133720 RepID=UPI0008BCCBF5|nr:AlpA family phage regulatory protein [Nitrosomonas sp. Nm51]SER46137.1 prophage regulatory protein [Nitrosomonas sp. Nm51]
MSLSTAVTPQHHQHTQPSERLLTIAEVAASVGFKSSSIYLKIQQGTFPKPLKIGTASRWRESEVQAWIKKQIQGGA